MGCEVGLGRITASVSSIWAFEGYFANFLWVFTQRLKARFPLSKWYYTTTVLMAVHSCNHVPDSCPGRPKLMLAICRFVALLLALCAVPAFGQQTTYVFDLDTAQVVTQTGVPFPSASGQAFVTLDGTNTVNVTIHHDLPTASILYLNTGAIGTTGNFYALRVITSDPIVESFTLNTPADAAAFATDGFYFEIQDSTGAPALRGQITNAFTGQVYISEYCNDPIPASLSLGLDTNGDGIPSTSSSQGNDEFVEIVNGTNLPVILDNWTISDAASGGTVRHTFPVGTTVLPGEAITVFGGGNLTNFLNFGLLAQAASTFALGLNNGADSITLADSTGALIDTVAWISQGPNDGEGESITRFPETAVGAWARSTTLPFNPTDSPGRRATNIYPWSVTTLPIAAYPGNGTDAAIEVSINGVVDGQPTNIHNVTAGDIVTFRYYSPNMTLFGAPFIAVAQPFTTGFPAPASGFPGDPVATIRYSGALITHVLADGLSNPFLPFAPILANYSQSGYVPLAAAGMNLSYMVLLITQDLGINAVDFGNAPAHELIVQ
ncbi:MAG: hypothetical protein ACI97A_001307 [Planctomycetota bacterium]|jgi:hypothetical protein